MSIARGLVAGAAGTVALNALTYLDMAVRGRPASSLPADTVERAARIAGADLSDEGRGEAGRNRREGLGALLGYAAGLTFGGLYGALRDRTGDVSVATGALALTAVAMVGANLPSVAMGVTDPRDWGTGGWIADIVPHLAYGVVTAGVHHAIDIV